MFWYKNRFTNKILFTILFSLSHTNRFYFIPYLSYIYIYIYICILHETQGLQSKFHELNIYIYIYLSIIIILYNSSILDIEHSPYYIALGSTQSDLVTTNTVIIYIYIYIYNLQECKNVNKWKVDTYVLNSRADVRSPNSWAVCYLSNIKLCRFWSQLEASSVSSLTKESWYNETVVHDIYIMHTWHHNEMGSN